jgi:antitoxin VapB
MDDTVPLRERIRDIQDRIAAYPDTGLEADKAFFDELSGDE